MARRVFGAGSLVGRPRFRLLFILSFLSADLAAGALSASPALAAQARIFQGAFGCAEGAPGCTVPGPYPLAATPWSVALNDSTGDVYVADALNHRVQEFNAKGEFLLMFGKEVNKTKQGGLPSEANVCDPEKELAVECQPGVASSEPGGFESIGRKQGGGTEPSPVMFVAVDNSSGESRGDVYVADHVGGGLGLGNRVSKFDSSGHLLSTWGVGGELVGGGAKSPFGEIQGIAVDASGDLWVGGAAKQTTFEFEQAGGLKAEWLTPGFPLPFGVAVDAQDDVYFVEGGHVREMTAAGVEVGVITEEELATYGAGVDPSTSQLYVLDQGREGAPVQLQRYLPGCRPTPIVEGPPCTAAETFTSRHLTAEFAEGHGLAVNPGEGETVYVSSGPRASGGEIQFYSVVTVPAAVTSKPSSVSGISATLSGSVNPSGVALKECFFEYGETTGYGQRVSCAESVAQIGSGSTPVAVHAAIAVQAGKSYHYRLLADNVNDEKEPAQGADLTLGPPLLSGESSVAVASATAKLQALVDPQSVDTRVRVQYGTTAGYGGETADVDIGAGSVSQPVPVRLEGLAPGTEYHYRFVAENALGEGPAAVVGPDRVFVTQGAGSFRLPDARAWELVSPRERRGASIEPLGSSYAAGEEIQAAADGSAISYLTNDPLEDVHGFPEFAQVLSTRGASGWVSRDLSVPHSGSTETTGAVTEGREYRYFSEDLSHAAVQPQGPFEPCASAQGTPQPCVSPLASEQTAFVQDLGSGAFTPLVTGCPSPEQEAEGHPCPQPVAEHADVPAGTIFGQTSVTTEGPAFSACPPQPYCGPFFQDATPDFGHVVVKSPVALSGEPGATKGLYEWAAGRLAFVGEGRLGARGSAESTDDRHAISDDGSRVFWTAREPQHLYMRVTTSGALLQLDSPEAECVAKGGCKAGEAKPEFQLASSDGGRVLFTDTQRLTVGSGASGSAPDLYECRIVEAAGKPSCALTDLTPSGGTESAGVQGVVLGAGEDGSYVYFVTDGVLGDGSQHGATPGDCRIDEAEAPSQHCNLYVSHEGVTRLVAVLSGMDQPVWGAKALGAPTARVSPDGRWLAFMSNRSLTGYDNRDAVSGVPDEEVYLYDAATERLVCASCDPTGARPHGREYQNENGMGLENGLVASFQVWYPKTWLAANIPTWTPQSFHNALYQSRYLSDSGRLFFNTLDGLVPKDANSQQDVYEYEPEGVGPASTPSGGEGARCEPSAVSGSEVYRPQHEYEVEVEGTKQNGTEGAGCVALISSGTSGEESAFMDASQTGSDVFFISSAHLVPGTIENGTSLYDAHVCTTASPCHTGTEAPPACKDAEGCRPAPEPQPPIYGPPSSATFHGPGNPTPEPPAGKPVTKPKTAAQIRAEKLTKARKACRKDRSKKKRLACERAARKAYGAKASARRSSAAKARKR